MTKEQEIINLIIENNEKGLLEWVFDSNTLNHTYTTKIDDYMIIIESAPSPVYKLKVFERIDIVGYSYGVIYSDSITIKQVEAIVVNSKYANPIDKFINLLKGDK